MLEHIANGNFDSVQWQIAASLKDVQNPGVFVDVACGHADVVSK